MLCAHSITLRKLNVSDLQEKINILKDLLYRSSGRHPGAGKAMRDVIKARKNIVEIEKKDLKKEYKNLEGKLNNPIYFLQKNKIKVLLDAIKIELTHEKVRFVHFHNKVTIRNVKNLKSFWAEVNKTPSEKSYTDEATQEAWEKTAFEVLERRRPVGVYLEYASKPAAKGPKRFEEIYKCR